MAAVPDHPGAPATGAFGISAWRNRLIASRRLQRWVAAFPLTRPLVRREGGRLFDLMAGFAYSQMLLACVELDLLARVRDRPRRPEDLATSTGLRTDRMATLCQAAASLGLLERTRDGAYGLGRFGAQVLAVPGVSALVRHHALFYRDLRDPVAFLAGDTETELAAFWPYTGSGEVGAEAAQSYSELMSASQALVAEEVLASVRLDGARHLMDVGGGTGAFLACVAEAYPDLQLTLFDLPAVTETAARGQAGRCARMQLRPGDFRAGPLPDGADTISLIRILFDHPDGVVSDLLARIFAVLPPGGRLIVAEPMSGGAKPCRFGDVYFALYTLAMRSGHVRTPERIAELILRAGFKDPHTARGARPFVSRVISAIKSA